MQIEQAANIELFANLAVALGIGLLIGLERGWQQREAGEGQRVAGLRTFALIGLAGGASGLLAALLGAVVMAVALFAMAVILVSAHIVSTWERREYGITSEMASFIAFTLGALATMGQPAVAGAGAVVVTVLLGLKPELHDWLERLDREELLAALKLLMLSVVVLPLLPDTGMGPWEAFNPNRLWWLVVLIAAIAFTGHFAVRLLGETRGILLTGVFGGMASSSALTLSFARLARNNGGRDALLLVGITLAQAMVFPRMLVVAFVVSPSLALAAAPSLAVMAGVCVLVAVILWLGVRGQDVGEALATGSPFRLRETLRFGVLLVAVTAIAEAGYRFLGTGALYAVAAVTAIADVNAITLSVAQLYGGDLGVTAAVLAVVIAAASSVVVKVGLIAAAGCPRLALRAALLLLAVPMAGGAAVWGQLLVTGGWSA
ncbi:MgtC/SapB family protein [Arhodomonas sp. AD133]|uniref:MgtC/SapB family protein n=1 Tax=Arhodomonas sp. AD133 TaxID=3415009 RepID=UPI003EBF8125